MTENEKIIEEANEIAKGRMYATNEVIRLQKELEQYRAIGTVEEMKELKKNIADFPLDCGSMISDVKEIYHQLTKYLKIGTIEEFKALKEKNEPKNPDYEGDGCWGGRVVIDTWICPNCEKHYEVDYDDYDYCPNCGQHIDHSGLTEDD